MVSVACSSKDLHQPLKVLAETRPRWLHSLPSMTDSQYKVESELCHIEVCNSKEVLIELCE